MREAGTEQVPQVLKKATAVQTYAATDARVAWWFFAPFGKKAFVPIFLKGSTVLQSARAKKKAAVKTGLLLSVSTIMEALLIFHSIGYVNDCLCDRRLHADYIGNGDVVLGRLLSS